MRDFSASIHRKRKSVRADIAETVAVAYMGIIASAVVDVIDWGSFTALTDSVWEFSYNLYVL